jgi:hypothetical protein
MPSLCTGAYLREYFQSGSLPAKDTICQPDWKPFLGCLQKNERDGTKCKSLDEEDGEMWGALVGLNGWWD